jgi:hypothetical protein
MCWLFYTAGPAKLQLQVLLKRHNPCIDFHSLSRQLKQVITAGTHDTAQHKLSANQQSRLQQADIRIVPDKELLHHH